MKYFFYIYLLVSNKYLMLQYDKLRSNQRAKKMSLLIFEADSFICQQKANYRYCSTVDTHKKITTLLPDLKGPLLND